jgi:hypothetical protein
MSDVINALRLFASDDPIFLVEGSSYPMSWGSDYTMVATSCENASHDCRREMLAPAFLATFASVGDCAMTMATFDNVHVLVDAILGGDVVSNCTPGLVRCRSAGDIYPSGFWGIHNYLSLPPSPSIHFVDLFYFVVELLLGF